MDPGPWYDACYRDACACDSGGDCECLCTAVAAYGHECCKHGVPIKWRTQELCRKYHNQQIKSVASQLRLLNLSSTNTNCLKKYCGHLMYLVFQSVVMIGVTLLRPGFFWSSGTGGWGGG